MESPGKVSDRQQSDFIDSFITSQVTGRGLDERTEKAYRLDLEHFYRWLRGKKDDSPGDMAEWEGKIDQYLAYLSQERRLRASTISRKYRVFRYFLSYLARQGVVLENHTREQAQAGKVQTDKIRTMTARAAKVQTAAGMGSLSKGEVDAFFHAIRREKENLDSDFRKRVCLRDQVMMGLLFYHGIEVSEMLGMSVSDYDMKTGILTVRKKRKKEQPVRVFSKELRGQLEQWIDEHQCFERDNEFSEKMFLSKLGRPLSMKMVILIFEKYRKLAGIEKEFTPKDLKNSLGRYGRELVEEKSENNVW